MKQKLQNFMIGRYGADQLSKFMIVISFVLIAVSLFIRNNGINMAILFIMFYTYFRMFSRNISKRYAENQFYMKYRQKVIRFFTIKKSYMEQKNQYRFFKCPNCKQQVRVPKGRGKIAISCPKCREEFIRKS